MGVVQFFRILWARRVMILVALVVTMGAAVLIAKLVPPRYEASSRVMLDIVKPDPVTGEVIQSQFMRAFVSTQQELIKDYRTAGIVVDELGWTQIPELARQYDASGAQEQGIDFRRFLAQRIIDFTTVKLIEGSNILEITFTSTNGESAAKVADVIRSAYIQQTASARRGGAREDAEWFEQQLGEVRQRLTVAEQAKASFERANGVVLADDMSDPEVQRLQSLATVAPPPPVVTPGTTIAASAPPVAASAGALASLDAQITTVGQQLGPNHPQLQQMRQQRAALQSQVNRELAASSAAGQVRTTAPTVSGGVSAASLYRQQQAKVLADRGKVDEARRLAQDVAVLREQYQTTAKRAADLSQQAQARETGLTPLGNAVTPDSPVFPKWPLVVFGSLALGLVLGVLAALVTELLRRRVRGEEDMVLAGVPVIGSMPRRVAA